MTNDIPTRPLDEIGEFLRRFVVFNDQDHAEVIALWILHTWTFDAAYATPYLYVHSAEPQSGKTRVLEVCELLARQSVTVGHTSAAYLFRQMAEIQPTVFLDEVDTVFTGSPNEELRAMLNSGYKHGGTVGRFVGGESQEFPVFCPKMLVGIDNGQMPDTLRDRCIPIALKRKRTSETVERFVPRKIEAEAAELRARIQRWASRNLDRIMAAPDPKVIEGISDRSFEIAEPLLMLAPIAGDRGAAKARAAIKRLMEGKQPALSLGIQTLMAARKLMDDTNMDRISSAALADEMGVSPKKLGVVLAAYDISPMTVRFASGERLKGYHRVDFKDAWERYL